ncbi:hypothetical protein AL073_18200 [Loktanella sp. 1ANDIMAR09]|nr:hypothetical protein AL073_18200 [Loktanella sp. 1ANDIMAR09]
MFEAFAAQNNAPLSTVYINMIPIIIGTGSEFIGALRPHINAVTTESEAFVSNFENVAQANFSAPEYAELSSSLFG